MSFVKKFTTAVASPKTFQIVTVFSSRASKYRHERNTKIRQCAIETLNVKKKILSMKCHNAQALSPFHIK